MKPDPKLSPPLPPKKKHETVVHGVTLNDDYFWMKDRGSAEVLNYLNAENAYLEAVLKPTEGLQRKLTLISAPAGFGKTTLTSAWVAGCGRSVAWLSLY